MNFSFKVLISLLLSLSLNQVIGQSCFDEIKDQEIPFETISTPQSSLDSSIFFTNLYCFIGEDLDSVDLEILCDGPYLGLILFKSIEGNSQPTTYGDLKQLMIQETKDLGYAEMRDLHLLTRDFSKLPAVYENWDEDKHALLKLGIPEIKLKPFEEYLKTHSDPAKNYNQLMSEFEQSKQVSNEVHEEELNNILLQARLDALLKNGGVIQLDSLQEISKSENKPILLYFTGYTVASGRKLERVALKNDSIISSLESEFVFTSVFVDDRREISKEQWKHSEVLDKTVKTIGDLNIITQIELCSIASQPYFVALTQNGEIIGTGEYADFKAPEDFLDFLKRIKSKFEE